MEVDRERSLVAASRDQGAAFGELYDFYAPRILGFIYRRVRDYSVAEDLTSMTFQRAFENVRRAEFRNDSFGGWLYRVASNAVIDHVRQDRGSLSLTDIGESDEPGDPSVDILAGAVNRDEVRRGLLALPDMHREILILRYFDDMDPAEMCAILGCSREALASRLYRALRALRGVIAREASDVA